MLDPRELTVVLQLILELGQLSNNLFALGLLVRVFGLANCLVQVINGTSLYLVSTLPFGSKGARSQMLYIKASSNRSIAISLAGNCYKETRYVR